MGNYGRGKIDVAFIVAQLIERDSLIFNENDVELFIDGGDCYYELELNAAGTIYEVLFVWQDGLQVSSRFDAPEFNPLARHALTFGDDLDRQPKSFWNGTHPRGFRWAYRDFDLPGLRTAVRVDGKINDDQHIDRGWTAELALPWSGLRAVAGDRDCPPRDGDFWRMFLGRFQKLEFGGVELLPHPCWCWTPHRVYDTHRPELWTSIRFTLSAFSSANERGFLQQTVQRPLA